MRQIAECGRSVGGSAIVVLNLVCRVVSEARRCYTYAKAQTKKVRAMQHVERQAQALRRAAQEQCERKAP